MRTLDAILTFDIHYCPTAGCGIAFGVEQGFTERRRSDAKSFHCPNGHSMSYGESEADKLRKQLETAERRLASTQSTLTSTRDQLESTQRSRNAYLGQVKSLKTRIGKGVCPCCNRTFANVARHMGTQHPDFIE